MIDRNTHTPFRMADLEELRSAIDGLKLELSVEEDTSFLTKPLTIAGQALPNSMSVQPMEGCDAEPDGAPGPLTFRRYKRFSAGGAGLLWFEACAVVPEGKANPRQLRITNDNKDQFARLLDESRQAASESMDESHRPFTVLQLTHSGRYSRPVCDYAPVIAFHDPQLDPTRGVSPDQPVISDDELERLEDAYVEAARLAFDAGFDAVDVKACHRYLLNELLAAHTREGRYGGSYENRTRFMKNVIGKIYAELGHSRIVTCRLGIHDYHPYPYGWGMDKVDPRKPDLTEPKRLVRELHEMGLPLINITMGNPYFRPHVNRPYDRPIEGAAFPDEHPLISMDRLVRLTREVREGLPDLRIIGSGYSWLRNLWPYIGSAELRDGHIQIVGLGRQAFAYPGFAKEIIETGRLERRHTCIACSSCTQIMRDAGMAGCVPFDKEVYGPIYREGRKNSIEYVKAQADRCRDCFDPQCREGCPAGVDIPAFVKAIADGDIKRSYEALRESNPLPEVCGLVCPAEVQCQGCCVENVFSKNPVPIAELQTWVSRKAREMGLTAIPADLPNTGRKVAVVGAGPSGLACAAAMLRMGHQVDIYETDDEPGGTAGGSIPEQRLGVGEFRAEIEAIFADVIGKRLFFHKGESLSANRSLDDLTKQYNAVFLGMGLGDSYLLDATRPAGVEDAVTFLKRVKSANSPRPLGEGPGVRAVPPRVAVIGGGNTAMDAASQAILNGARDVYIVYRRSFAEMPAWPAEINSTLELGVHFLLLTQPLGYETDADGKVKGIRVARTVLGEPDASGRRKPVLVEGTESLLETDLVLEAIGQKLPGDIEKLIPGVDLTSGSLIQVDAEGRTSLAHVYAGGDAVNGGATVVQAIAEGVRAARVINTDLG